MDEPAAQFQLQLNARQRKAVAKGLAKARTSDNMQELAKLTHLVGGRRPADAPQQPGPAGRRRAADAGEQRHLPQATGLPP